MIYIFHPSGNAQINEFILELALAKLKAKHRSLDCIKKRRERETLMKAMRGLEESNHTPIDKGCNLGPSDTGLDPSNESGVKAKPMQDLKKELISYSIESIS